jgi:uncharacterized membrane protein HdeD (DUF308 family)
METSSGMSGDPPVDASSVTVEQTSVIMTTTDEQAAVTAIGRFWWAWIVLGALWIIASFVILQFSEASATTVGIIIGIMLLVAGIQEFVVAAFAGGWKWLWYIFGAFFIIGGLWALFNPTQTFLAIADTLGFLFLLIGIFWVVEAFATRAMNPLWWLGLIAGILMVGLGFWATGQFLVTKAYYLLIFAGIWALLHGITDIIKAFQIKRLGSFPHANMAPEYV